MNDRSTLSDARSEHFESRNQHSDEQMVIMNLEPGLLKLICISAHVQASSFELDDAFSFLPKHHIHAQAERETKVILERRVLLE